MYSYDQSAIHIYKLVIGNITHKQHILLELEGAKLPLCEVAV